MRLKLTLLATVMLALSGFASKQLKFYYFKKAGKHINTLTRSISSDQPDDPKRRHYTNFRAQMDQ